MSERTPDEPGGRPGGTNEPTAETAAAKGSNGGGGAPVAASGTPPEKAGDGSAAGGDRAAETKAARDDSGAPDAAGAKTAADRADGAPVKAGGAADATPADASRPVYFIEVRLNDANNPRRLDLVRPRRAPALSEEMRTLMRGIREVARVIATVFVDCLELRKILFGELHVTAFGGLRGPDFDLASGFENLAEVKSNIADQFPAVRSYYWKRYGLFVLLSLAVALPLGVIVYALAANGLWNVPKPDEHGVYNAWVAVVIAALWIPVGVAVGLFLEYNSRVDTVITYERLQTINPARWDPFQRFINTTMLGYVLAAVMGIGIFQIGVSNVLLNEFFTSKPYLALVVGFVAGFATPYVQDIINQVRPTTRAGAQTPS